MNQRLAAGFLISAVFFLSACGDEAAIEPSTLEQFKGDIRQI